MTSGEQPRELSIKETDVEVMIVNGSTNRYRGRLVAEIELRSMEQIRVSLGKYVSQVLKGFAIAISPDVDLLDSVVARITRVESPEEYELILHIANYSNKTISAEVRRLL